MTLSKEKLAHYAAHTDGPVKAMARELLERRERDGQEATGEVRRGEYDDSGCHPDAKVVCLHDQADWEHFPEGFKLYAAPPAPVVPECFARFHEAIKERHHGRMPEEVQKAFDECAAMLGSTISNPADIAIDEASLVTAALNQTHGKQPASNSPGIPDGWIKCSECMPAENDIVIVVDDWYFVCEAQYRDGDFYSAVRGAGEFFETTCRDVELWQPLPAAPQQESE